MLLIVVVVVVETNSIYSSRYTYTLRANKSNKREQTPFLSLSMQKAAFYYAQMWQPED